MTSSEQLRRRLRQLADAHLGAELGARIADLARPAVRLVRTAAGADPGVMSRLGGDPMLPAGSRWPKWRGEPLSFLALIDLSEITPGVVDGLPDEPGLLNFFYAAGDQPWGSEPGDGGGWRVLGADLDDAWLTTPPRRARRFPARGLRAEPTLTIPGWEEDVLEDLTQEEQDRFDRLTGAWRQITGPAGDWPDGEPDHRVGGWPNLVQAPLWPVAQLASAGLDISHSYGYSGKQAAALHDGAGRWRLLLQLDTDDEMGWMWGDVGRLYFVIAEDDLRAGRFGGTWLVLQCG
jgi:Domain of unknown function (DUF1963)